MQQHIKGWYEFLDKPLAYTSYYNNPPKTLSINIESIYMDWRETSLTLCGLLPDFPDTPPERWKIQGFDGARMELVWDFFNELSIKDDVQRSKVHGPIAKHIQARYPNKVEIQMEKLDDGHIQAIATADGFNLRVTCGTMRVNSIRGYIKDREAAFFGVRV